jgi:DNA-binding IscR family transcriptional regulator
LAHPPEAISLIDILRVIDGDESTELERDGHTAGAHAQVWAQIRASEATVLAETSIASLLQRSNAQDWVI